MPPTIDSSSQAVTIARRDGQLAVVATRRVAADSAVLTIDGPVVAVPTRFTVQVGEREHVDAEAGTDGSHPIWRFLNHACEPNTRLVGRTLFARSDIEVGDEVTFDYDTTEWDMAAPFPCRCGAASCRGVIRGYRHLTPAQRDQIVDAAPHLREAVARPH